MEKEQQQQKSDIPDEKTTHTTHILALQDKLTKLSSQVTDINTQILDTHAQKMKELDDKIATWKKMEDKIQAEIAKAESRVNLNVGGKQFSVSKEVLLSQQDTYFTGLLASAGRWKTDKDGSYFIDRNPKYFKMIMEYMRRGKISSGPKSEEEKEALAEELDYFQISMTPQPSQQTGMKQAGQIEKSASATGSKLIEGYERQIETWLDGHKLGTIIYCASKDGFASSVFHAKCDDKGSTIVLIQSEGDYLFGGYAGVSWTSKAEFSGSRVNFLFTLENPHSIPPTMLSIKSNSLRLAQFGDARRGPTFGGGYDICIPSNSNESGDSYSFFPFTYNDPTGKGETLFVGKQKWKVKEIEVIQIIRAR